MLRNFKIKSVISWFFSDLHNSARSMAYAFNSCSNDWSCFYHLPIFQLAWGHNFLILDSSMIWICPISSQVFRAYSWEFFLQFSFILRPEMPYPCVASSLSILTLVHKLSLDLFNDNWLSIAFQETDCACIYHLDMLHLIAGQARRWKTFLLCFHFAFLVCCYLHMMCRIVCVCFFN